MVCGEDMRGSCPFELRAVNVLLSTHESGFDFDSQVGIPLISGRGLQSRSQVRFPMVSLEFFIDIIHPAALWPWG